ncbi:MAG: hypothetical protein WCG32_01160 [Actinomycetes bacterium]
MRKFGVTLLAATTALFLSACASNNAKPEVKLPDKPTAEAPVVNAADYANSYGGYVFRIGGGTIWCTINEDPGLAVCEHLEVDVAYKLPTTPPDCQGAWGYQARLWGVKQAEGKEADWLCAGGLYSDPEGIYDLPNGSKIVVGDITCFAAEQIARCDNTDGNYIVLGSDLFGFSS